MSGGGVTRLFSVQSGAPLTLTHLTVRDGSSPTDDGGAVFTDPCADAPGDVGGHHLGAPRPGIDMAMATGLVAEFADIDLEDRDACGAQRR